MKKILLFTLSLLLCANSYAQSDKTHPETDALIETVKGMWTNDGRNIIVQRIIKAEGKTKEQLFDIALEYVMNNYVNPKEVTQISERESGLLIIKGYYPYFYYKRGGYTTSWKCNAYHTIKLECKDDRMRITVTLDEARCFVNSGANYIATYVENYPFFISKRAGINREEGEIFYYSVKNAINSVKKIEKSILKSITSDKW